MAAASAALVRTPLDNPKNTKDKTKIAFSIETVTPDMAAEMLATSKHRNDRLASLSARAHAKNTTAPVFASNPLVVREYSEMMKTGGWIVNGMPIIGDREGHLIDGIARLEACVLSGIPIRTVIARNVKADVLHTVDQQKRRNFTGVLESRGIKHASAYPSLILKMIRIQNGLFGKDHWRPSWAFLDSVLEKNPEFYEAIELSEKYSGSLLHASPRNILVFMAIKAGKKEKMIEFLGGLKDRDSFPLGNPVRMLANQLYAEQRRIRVAKENDDTYNALNRDQLLAISIMAFNDFLNGKGAEEEYLWVPNYGKAKSHRDDPKKVRELAPANLGLPAIEGFEGIEGAEMEQARNFGSQTSVMTESLVRANEDGRKDQEIEMRLVTPEMAQQYLKLNEGNRKLSVEHKNKLAEDIKEGDWALNAQPICFTGDPDVEDPLAAGVRLLNGQHRLYACIEANMAIEVPIAINIPEEAFATYDGQARKSRMEVEDGVDARVLLASALLQWKVDNDIDVYSTGIKPSEPAKKRTIEAHPDMAKYYSRARTLKKLGSAAIMMFFMYHVNEDRPDIAEDFLKALETGDNIESRNPAMTARTKIIGLRTSGKEGENRVKIPRKDVLKTLMTAWEDYKIYRDELWEEQNAEKQLELV